jgi:hypothetical protein
MEARKMESTARIEEEREEGERDDERREDRVPEQSGANDQNRTDTDPGDQE